MIWLSKEEAMALVGDAFDEGRWNEITKNEKGEITLALLQQLARQSADAAVATRANGPAGAAAGAAAERAPTRTQPHTLNQWLGDARRPQGPTCHNPIDFYPISTLAAAAVALTGADGASVAPTTEVSAVTMQDTWGWDVLGLKTTNEVMEAVNFIFVSEGFLDTLGVSEGKLSAFTSAIGMLYLPNYYHNVWHAADVLFMTWRMLHDTGVVEWYTKLETVAALVAAFAHDAGHPAVNNNFLVATRSDIALRHNDKSPLENMHCAILYDVLKCEEAALFSNLSEQDFRLVRARVIQAILGTDMVNHFGQTKRLATIFDRYGAVRDGSVLDESDRMFSIEMFVHAADISNPAKKTQPSMKWSYLVTEEFFALGDLEREMGLPVNPMNDRDSVSIPNSQIGFIEFIVFPMFLNLSKVFPNLSQAGSNMIANTQAWTEVRKVELEAKADGEAIAEEVAKLEGRRSSLVEKQSEAEQIWVQGAEAGAAAKEVATSPASKVC